MTTRTVSRFAGMAVAVAVAGGLAACSATDGHPAATAHSVSAPVRHYSGIAAQLTAQGAVITLDTPARVTGVYQHAPFLCELASRHPGNYLPGVNASESDGAYLCGLTGYPTPAQNAAFAALLGWGPPA